MSSRSWRGIEPQTLGLLTRDEVLAEKAPLIVQMVSSPLLQLGNLENGLLAMAAACYAITTLEYYHLAQLRPRFAVYYQKALAKLVHAAASSKALGGKFLTGILEAEGASQAFGTAYLLQRLRQGEER